MHGIDIVRRLQKPGLDLLGETERRDQCRLCSGLFGGR
jgi:hypothetical protein